MMDSGQGKIVSQKLIVMYVVFGAVLLGELTFMAVVVGLRFSGFEPEEAQYGGVLPYIATVCAAGSILAAWGIRYILLGKMGRAESLEQAIQPYFCAAIVPLAICDGSTFFALVVLLLEGDFIWMLSLFVVLVSIQLTFFPSRLRLAQAYENARETQKIKDAL